MKRSEVFAALQQLGTLEMSVEGHRRLAGQLASVHTAHRPLATTESEMQMSIDRLLDMRDQLDVQSFPDAVVIPVRGPLEYRLSLLGWYLGFTSYRAISRAFQEALRDSKIKRIIMAYDSPGGSVIGLPELAEQMFAARGTRGKEIIAVADPEACSAALRLATTAKKFYVLESGYVGSIGTITFAESWAEFLSTSGIDARVISSPEPKGEGWPERPITEEYAAHLQELVDKLSLNFQTAVAKYRNKSLEHVAQKFGGGRVLRGDEAVAVKLADGFGTVEQFLTSPAAESQPMGKRQETPESDAAERSRRAKAATA